MSNLSNEELLARAGVAIQLAGEYQEHELQGTVFGDVLEMYVNSVSEDIEDDNLDDLYGYSLPALERKLDEIGSDLGDKSRTHFFNNDLMNESDIY